MRKISIALAGLLAVLSICANPSAGQNVIYDKEPGIAGEGPESSGRLVLDKAGQHLAAPQDPSAIKPDGAARGISPASRKALRRASVKNIRKATDNSKASKIFGYEQGNEMSAKVSGLMELSARDETVFPATAKQDKPDKVQGWGRNHAVSNYTDNQQRPSMAKDSQGRLYIAYDWLYSGNGKYEVWLARSTDGGNDWEDLFYLGDNNYNYHRPSLAITSNDQCFLFYQTDDTLGMQYLQSNNGDKWNFYYLPSWKANYPKCHWPKVAAGRKSDSTRVAVAWQYDYNGNGSDYDIGYAYSRNGGGSWLAGWSRIAGSGSQERYPSICISDSLIAVAYELYGNWATNDSVDIMYSRTVGLSAPQDTAWSAGVSGIATTRHDRSPDLAASGRYLYLAGQRAYNDQNDYDIVARSSKDGGKTFAAGWVYASATGAEEKYPAIWAQDTICYLAYTHDSAWAYFRWSADTGKTFFSAEIASDSSYAVEGISGIDLCLLGENPRVAWTDNRNTGWGLGFDIYFNTNLKNFPRACDLAPYKPESWEFPLVPSKLTGTYTVSDTLRGFGTTARDTTFIDLCVIDSSSVDVADIFRAGIFVDEWLYAYLEDYRLPAWWTETVADYPMRIFGGRHTLRLYADYEERILYERTRDNNVFSRQRVWTPYRMPDDTTLQVPTPPVNVIDQSVPDYNCDGYWQAATNYWSAVALKPAAGTDYDLRVYNDAYGKANAGFSVVAAQSALGPDTVEIIAVNGNKLTAGTRYYPGIYRGPKTGDGDYFAQFCLQDGTIPNNGWSTEKRMGDYQIVHTYDVDLTAGLKYYAACSLKAGPASLGFAVFSPTGAIYKSRSQAVGSFNEIAPPGKQFQFTADTSGWHSFVVWHNTPAKGDTSRYFVGLNTSNFGLPQAVELSYFTAQAYPDSIVLKWRTETEKNTDRWLIERSTAPEDGYLPAGATAAQAHSNMPCEYSWTDGNVSGGQLYYYRLGEQETDGKVNYFGPISVTAIGSLQIRNPLLTVSPNPFKQSASIIYQVAEQNANVSVNIYNLAGQRVRSLISGVQAPGRYRANWDGADDGGMKVSAGCYFLAWSIGKDDGVKKIAKIQ
ncbi:MAG: hypothetical protein KJ844_10305 [Candidatus Edwardsbacteria bacterium]|nr:hypothetical protein [Candidatus Edwardsbacteria bacterium]